MARSATKGRITARLLKGKSTTGEPIYMHGRELNRHMHETIKAGFGWNEQEYRKNYDLYKNRLRAFEEVTGLKAQGKQTSPLQSLFDQAAARLAAQRANKPYKEKQLYKDIWATQAYSLSKAARIFDPTANTQQRQKWEASYNAQTNEDFKELIAHINASPNQKLKDLLKDINALPPFQRRKALEALAHKMDEAAKKRSADQDDEMPANSSDIVPDFNIDDYK